MITSPVFYSGVQCIVVDPKNASAVLLGRRSGTTGHGEWALPGGHIEEEETAILAAVRELKEETGLEGLDASVLPSFITWWTDHPYAHFPVIFAEVMGTPELQVGENFSELQYFPFNRLPEPLFATSRETLRMFRAAGFDLKRYSPQGYMQLEMLALNAGERKNAAWTLRGYFTDGASEVVVSWGRRMARSRNVRRESFSTPIEAKVRVRKLIMRRLQHRYSVTSFKGDFSVEELSSWVPGLSLAVVSSDLLIRLSRDPVARAAFSGESAAGLQFELNIGTETQPEPQVADSPQVPLFDV